MTPSNFSFLATHWPDLAAHGAQAEGHFYSDPHACLMKLRFFLESLLVTLLEKEGLDRGENTLEDMINLMRRRAPRDLAEAMHELRRLGNQAAHEGKDYLEDAERALRIAHRTASWAGKTYLELRAGAFERPRPKLALAWTYGLSLGRIEPEAQRAVREVVERIEADPFHSSLDYASVPGGQTTGIRTIAAGDHSLVALRGSRGDVVMLAWVGPTAEAIAWAREAHIEIHRLTGALQIYTLPAMTYAQPAAHVAPLFARYSDEELAWTGVPDPLVPAVRLVRSAAELDQLQEILPQEAYEALHGLVAGRQLDEVIAELLEGVETRAIDTNNFAAAMARPDTRRRIIEIQGPEELREVMDAPLDLWRVFLHPRQEKLAKQDFAGPARVLGGAGTGKTVVLMHRARHLAREVFTGPDDRILILTYTMTLAEHIRDNMANMGGPELARITVQHLHGFARELLAEHGRDVPWLPREAEDAAWEAVFEQVDAGDFAPRFYRTEWSEVVVAQGLRDLGDYMAASREGRRTSLSEGQRREVWAVFEAYRAELKRQGLVDYAGQLELAETILAGLEAAPFRSVLVDETQDMGPIEFGLIRRLAAPGPNDLFIVGDAYQKIFPRRLVLKEAGIELGDRSEVLTLNYRTTSQIRDWAVAVLDGHITDDLDGGEASLEGYHSVRSGPVPEWRHFASDAEEAAQVVAHVQRLLVGGEEAQSICVCAFQNKSVERYAAALTAAGVPAWVMKPYEPEEAGVVVATMHRIKGLEFKHVVIAGVNAGEVPPVPAGEVIELAVLRQAQRLIYTTAARGRDSLLVTSFGMASPVLAPRERVLTSRVAAAEGVVKARS